MEQTNLNAFKCMGENIYALWIKVAVKELQAFIGFMILMGIARLPALSDNWSKDNTLRYGAIADKISRDRFLEIHRYLHFSDNATLAPPGSPDYDKLGKIRHVINSIKNCFPGSIQHTSGGQCR